MDREPKWVDTLYEKIAEDDEGRVCTAISEEACRETPGNFFRILLSNLLTQTGDRIASAKTTIPWILGILGSPGWMVGLLVPIRESGSMLPQIWIGGVIRKRPIRKTVWTMGSVLQGLSLGLMGWFATTMQGLSAGVMILLSLSLFSIARAACSIAYKDVLGKTIPKTRRGRLSGWISATAGVLTLLTGLGMGRLSDADSIQPYVMLLVAAMILWFIAAIIFQRVVEFEGETGGGKNGFKEALSKLSLIRSDKPFRKFVIGRALAMGSGLAAPFYLLLARDDLGGSFAYLGLFIAAEGLAGIVSAPIWGKWADKSSRRVFQVACTIAATATLLVVLWVLLSPPSTWSTWFYPFAFFLLGLAHAGVRLGRKTYLIDMAEGNKRTDYVAVSNSLIGCVLLIIGALSSILSILSPLLTLAMLALSGIAAAAISTRWKEVSEG